MFHFPKYYIFIFVGLSVLAAYGIHRHQLKQIHSADKIGGERKTASVEVEEFAESSIDGSAPVEQSMTSTMTSSELENFEDISLCSPDRLRWESSWSQISPLFREERAQNSTDFPRQCLTYMMRKSSESSTKGGQQRAYCQNSHSNLSIEDGSEIGSPCVSKNYVNSIYNFFADVSDCLETPQRAQLPEIFTLSGGHINAVGSHLEAGLAQLRAIPLAKANQEFKKFQKQILNSSKQSCLRLSPAVKLMVPIDLKSSTGCGLISIPENPLASLLYLNIRYLQDRDLVQAEMRSEKITERMKNLGLSEPTYDPANLQQILLIMAHVSGAQNAVLILGNYLKHMEASKKTLTVADFNFALNPRAPEGHPSFPEFIQKNLDKKVSQYLLKVRHHADQLNQEFKEGVCAPNSFLAL